MIKTSGDDEGIFVNDVFSGARTETANFTAYINPYLVVSKGGQYTKHIYIGSQRIVSKLGDLESYGSDPRRIEYAGANTDGGNVDYKGKYTAAQQTIKDRYAQFEVPYHGVDNDDYVNGQGFCCDDIPKTRSFVPNKNDNPELFQYYYHSDHLGSSSLITNLDGAVVQHIEYVPFGEVFIEERNNKWNTPYLFNAKELDEETGLYYYHARYYDPKTSVWASVDPIASYNPFEQENFIDGQHNGGFYNSFNHGVYSYCYQNPIRLVDPNGKQTEASKYREVTIHVSGKSNGNTYVAKTYPMTAGKFYEVPVYDIFVRGVDKSGNKIEKQWEVLRFMPFLNTEPSKTGYKTKTGLTPIMSGLSSPRKQKLLDFNPDYQVSNTFSPEDGAFRVTGSFLIHDGPDDLVGEAGAWGAAGCLEVVGPKSFLNLKKAVFDLSGSSNPDMEKGIVDFAKSGKLNLNLEGTTTPIVKEHVIP